MSETVGFLYEITSPPSMAGKNPPIGHLDLVFSELEPDGIQGTVIEYGERTLGATAIKARPVSSKGVIQSRFQEMPLRDIGLLYNCMGRPIRMQQLQEPGALPPVIYENAVFELDADKSRMHSEILEPTGISIDTTAIHNVAEAGAFLDRYDDVGEFIVKPVKGRGGRGVQRLQRDAVLPALQQQPELLSPDNMHIIQPAFDFSIPLPDSIKPYDTLATPGFQQWSQAQAAKEIRLYTFHSPAGTDVFPVGRAIQNGDHWFFVDPDSIPAHLLETARLTTRQIAQATGSLALYSALDVAYGAARPQDDRGWRAVELNASYPYIINKDEGHPGIVRYLRHLIANQIRAVIRHG